MYFNLFNCPLNKSMWLPLAAYCLIFIIYLFISSIWWQSFGGWMDWGAFFDGFGVDFLGFELGILRLGVLNAQVGTLGYRNFLGLNTI